MPELPEVESVRLGLAAVVVGAVVSGAEVRDPRALKRHAPACDAGLVAALVGADPALRVRDFERRMLGARLGTPRRRGKFLWIPLLRAVAPLEIDASRGDAGHREALLAHLGMSGQLLLRAPGDPDDRHVRIRLWLEHPEHGELRLDFADQRCFGSLAVDALHPDVAAGRAVAAAEVPVAGGAGGAGGGAGSTTAPRQVAHIARDPLDPRFDEAGFVLGLRRRSTAVKRALLDQGLVSGIGNIYADEALWHARVHPETPARRIGVGTAIRLLTEVRAVFARALVAGGTSFDAQYVNVNGRGGSFSQSLNVYGLGGQPCKRCGTPILRERFMNRSSHFCPFCQRKR